MAMIKKTFHPDHYLGKVEPIDLIISLGLGPAYCRANIIKYISRYDKKDGMKDLLKAKQYLEWLIELETKDGNGEEGL